jgi:hypothetical protein
MQVLNIYVVFKAQLTGHLEVDKSVSDNDVDVELGP